MDDDSSLEEEEIADCADEGMVLDGPATILRALIDIEPSRPDFTSALWRGVAGSRALNHRADSLAGLSPEPS